ncbi:DUF6507 family protein [Microterricola viridarii]|uniref:Excreted virulence factor EspC, type VII ESX diderm n=1 Tax=Microterricola viridarii TaxID=412690 RepID=A0A1H1NM77_9MICO|nr:DUF6507 family protein [Microterricola viridarii]SDS00017.1 hypothetical protein SAMN04489834_0674 [Microterricola viridarii]
MTSWQLTPAGIQKTLVDTSAEVETLAAAITTMATAISEPLQTGCGFDGIVSGAVVGFLDEQVASRVQPAMNRYGAALQATACATNAYLTGDEEMAISTLAATEKAADTGDFSAIGGGA